MYACSTGGYSSFYTSSLVEEMVGDVFVGGGGGGGRRWRRLGRHIDPSRTTISYFYLHASRFLTIGLDVGRNGPSFQLTGGEMIPFNLFKRSRINDKGSNDDGFGRSRKAVAWNKM